MRFIPLGTVSETPSMVRVTCSVGLSGISISGNRRGGQALLLGDVVLELVPERRHVAPHGHGDGVPQGTDGVSLDPIAHVDEEVQVGHLAPSALEPLEDLNVPAGPLAAGSALAASLVSVEARQVQESV